MAMIPGVLGALEPSGIHVSFRFVVGSIGTSLRYPASKVVKRVGPLLPVKCVLANEGTHLEQILLDK